jgi:hypothetical protein
VTLVKKCRIVGDGKGGDEIYDGIPGAWHKRCVMIGSLARHPSDKMVMHFQFGERNHENIAIGNSTITGQNRKP